MIVDDLLSIQEFLDLPEPLVPLPDVDITCIEDIYCVGQSPLDRWRPFIDATNWDPKLYHDKVLASRAFHARSAWEATLLLSFTNSSWLSVGTFEMIRDTAHFELRRNEFQLMSFQLTCGMLGINCSDKEALFQAAVCLFTTSIWIATHILDETKNKKKKKGGRVAFVEMKSLRPYSVDTKKELGRRIDELIHTIFSFMEHETFLMLANSMHEKIVKDLGNKLKHCILLVDPILHVL